MTSLWTHGPPAPPLLDDLLEDAVNVGFALGGNKYSGQENLGLGRRAKGTVHHLLPPTGPRPLYLGFCGL